MDRSNIGYTRIFVDKNPNPQAHWYKNDLFLWTIERSYDGKSYKQIHKGTKSNRRSALKKARKKADYENLALFPRPDGRIEETCTVVRQDYSITTHEDSIFQPILMKD